MPQPRSTDRGQIQPIVAVALSVVAVVGIVAAVLVFRPAAAAPGASPSPSAPAAPSASADPGTGPSASPSAPVSPSPVPTVSPTPVPSTGPLAIKLDNATNHDVSMKIQNPDSLLTDARTGRPSDGMSVRWHDALVVNTDAETIRLTWVGLPQDEIVDLVVTRDGAGVKLTLVQTGPMPLSDAMGEDRVVILTFAAPVRSEDITIEILDRTID